MPRKSTYAKKEGKTSQDDVVKDVVQKFDSSWNYCQSNYHKTWENAFKLYNNTRVKIGYEGYSNIFVPITFSTIETMVAALAGGKPSFDFLPPKEKPDQNTDILNALIDYYWDRDQWNIKVQSWIRSMLMYGTGVVYLYWNIDRPVMVNVPLRDFFFDPNAVNMENSGLGFYAGRRYLTTLDELKSYEIADPNDVEVDEDGNAVPKMKPKYKNLDKIPQGSGANDGDETDKARKDLFYGSTAPDPEKTQVEVIELWTEEKICSVVNRSVLIQEEENPYLTQAKSMDVQNPKGIIPFCVQRDYVDESLFLGKGEVEVIADQQELLNDLTNQNQDAITYTLNPMWNLNPNKVDMIDQVGAAPGRVFPLDQTDLTPVTMPSIPNDAFQERLNIKNEIRETTAIDQVVKGVSSDQKTTATEINAQIASAGQRMSMKITQLENEGFHRLARVVFEMVKLYVNEPMLVRVVGDSISWETFDPMEFQGDYEPRVQLQTSVEAKKENERKMAQEMYLALIQDPQVDQTQLKRMILPRIYDLDPDEVDKLLVDPMSQMGSMGLPPEDMGMMPPVETLPPLPIEEPVI